MTAVVAPPVRNVYACIVAVSAELAREGIAKDRNNQAQGYKFRGIDDIFNALGPVLAKNQLVIIPRIVNREVTERQTLKGGTLFYVVLSAEFEFVSAADGSSTIVRTYGEAMDSADKATNKAMSAAYKYAALMTFAIPTEGDHDTDASNPPEVITNQPPAGFDDWFHDMLAGADNGVASLQAAWAASDPERREYAETHFGAEWIAAKKRSAVVDRARKAAAK